MWTWIIAPLAGLLVETAKPGAAFGAAPIIDFGTPFWSLSVSTNVLATLLIAARLALRPRALAAVEGARGAAAAAVFLESAALYAVCALVYIPLFARDLPLQFPFSALLGSAAVRACAALLGFTLGGVLIWGRAGYRAALDHPPDG